MLEFTKTFLILFKYKYRRKWLILLLLLLFCLLEVVSECNENNCLNGVCNNDICVCNEGWRGPECQHCDSKIKLTNRVGWLSDGPNNYSVNVKCSWLITSDTVEPIRLRLETFATECGWDHLYIYDGDSVRAPLLAVYSGILDETWDLWSRQVIAHSGRALIHFFSDDAFSLPGFNVSYAVGWCPSDRAETNCSDHGTCSDGGVCICDTGWKGLACEKNMCPKNCSWVNGGGVCTEHGCQCENGRRGEDCSHYEHQDYWEVLNDWNNGTGVASHTLLWWNGRIMRVGGETHGELDDSEPILSELKPSGEWETVDVTGETPAPRYLHAATVVGDTLYVYGGAVLAGPSRDVGGREARTQHVTNELWTLSGTPPVWRNVTPAGPRVAGHTLLAVPHRDRVLLLTFFGHSPELGYMAWTRELREGVWWTWTTRGSAARGGFAHSVAWDPLSGRILMHGGLVSQSESGQRASSALYELDPTRRHWRKLSDAPHARYMHTALIVQPGVMLVFGGNVHNESGTYSKCFSNSASLYSIRDDMWYEVHAPPGTAPRAAHSMILASQPNYTYTGVYDVIVHGGFSGRLRSDTVQLHFGSCKGRQMHECFGTCRWSDRGCIRPDFNSPCISNDCTGCLQSGCVWCGNRCTSKATNCNVHETQRPVVIIQDCTDLVEERERDHCGRLHSCAGCHAHSLGCAWDYETARCRPHNSSHDKTMSCGVSCDSLSTCTNCTAEECIWCSSTMRCVDKNAYSASFPLGGCRAWSTSWCGETHTPIDMQTDVSPATGGGGLSSVDGCGAHATCSSCRREPACGWCDDGSGTGRGTCVAGSQREPHVHHCEAGSWYWESCPACQCNGHSVCDNITNVCLQPCSGRSVGEHCETCAPMHYGNPLNGGECRPCTCVGAAASCVSESGRCVCAVKGLAGDKCDRCDANNHYHSDPHNKGNCYYDLAIDYQFTFNLSKKEDRHLRAINFRNAPVKADVDADFSISCSSSARLNLTVRTRTMPERILIHDLNCTTFRYRFAKSEHAFGVEENMTLTTFFVYVYDFKPPLWIQISFSQYPKLNLQQFFVTFSSCFLLLLLVAGALWKAKQRYDAVRRRRRLYLEMEQMASRAFAQLQLELTPGSGASESGWASPVSLEPCAGGGAAVLSLVVRLPTGGTQRAPPHGGLALASALVALGHHHREDKLYHLN